MRVRVIRTRTMSGKRFVSLVVVLRGKKHIKTWVLS